MKARMITVQVGHVVDGPNKGRPTALFNVFVEDVGRTFTIQGLFTGDEKAYPTAVSLSNGFNAQNQVPIELFQNIVDRVEPAVVALMKSLDSPQGDDFPPIG